MARRLVSGGNTLGRGQEAPSLNIALRWSSGSLSYLAWGRGG